MLPALLPAILATPVALSPGPGADGDTAIQAEIDQVRAEIAEFRRGLEGDLIDRDRARHIRSIVADVLGESELRTSLRNTYAPDDDWNVFGSEDGRFTMEVNYFLQADWIYNRTESEHAEYGFQIQRSRLTFSGNVFGDTFGYYCRLDSGDGQISTEATYLQLNFAENWSLQGGLIYSMFSLEENISSDMELGVNLSFVAGQFDQETQSGLVLAWQGDSTRFWLTYSNGFGQTDVNPMSNTRQGFMFRVGYKPFGNWDSLYDFNPHPETTEPGILLGFAAAQDWGTSIDQGTTVTGPATRATADVTWQMSGFSIMSAAYYQDWSEGGNLGGTRWAAVGQVTGFLTPKFQLYGRYEWGRIMDSLESDVSMLTAGMSYYPFKTRTVKYSLECLYSFGSTTNWLIDGDPGIRLTTEPQAIIRSQIQLGF